MNDLMATVDEAFDYHSATLTQLKGVRSHERTGRRPTRDSQIANNGFRFGHSASSGVLRGTCSCESYILGVRSSRLNLDGTGWLHGLAAFALRTIPSRQSLLMGIPRS